MKKSVVLAVLSLFLMGVAIPCQASTEATKTYTNRYFLYSVDYPETWHAKEVSKVSVFYTPRESTDDKFSENVQIVVEDLKEVPGAVSLVDYHRTGVATAQKILTDFKLLEEAQTRWLGRDTIIMLYTATIRGEYFKFKDYKFMVNQTAYVLTYCATTASFDAYLPAAERLMRSIRVSP